MRSGIGPACLTILVATLGMSLFALYANPRVLEHNVFKPYWVRRNHRYYTWITSGLLHADLPHLIFNGVTFWFFAIPLEREIGTIPFAALYLIGLVASLLPSWFKHRDDPDYGTLGASGAICAALFAAIVYQPQSSLLILPIPIPIPAPLYALGYLVFSWYSGRQNQGRINHDAHFGGAITGLLFVAVTDPGAYSRAARLLFG